MKTQKIKKMLAGLSSACVMASALPLNSVMYAAAETAGTHAYYWLGDADCDDSLSADDALTIQKYRAKQITLDEESMFRADANLDDEVDMGDAVKILKMLSEGKSEKVERLVSDASYIHLKNTSIETEGENVTVEGSKVTITASGAYYVDGTIDDGQICVNIADETVDSGTVRIILNGATINGLSAPAIYVENAEDTTIYSIAGADSSINDGDSVYAGDYADCAVIHAKDDLAFKGNGTLEITANMQNAIHCNNDIVISRGCLNITTSSGDAIRGKKSVTVEYGTINIDSSGDGIKSTKGNVLIENGKIEIKAGNDAIQAETTIDIAGGTVTASGDRGLTSITGTNITGGRVVATATDYQAEFVSSTQGTMLLNCIDDTTNSDNCWKKANAISVSSNGTKLFTAAPLKKFKYVLISDPAIKSDSEYTLLNESNSLSVTHTDNTSSSFNMSAAVTSFETVNLSSASSQVVTTDLTITLANSGISTNATADVASISGNVITIKKPGVFAVSGEMAEGQIVVDVDKTTYPEGVVELDLVGMNLSNTTDSPIYVSAIGDECQIVAKKGTENTISDGTNYTNADGKMGAIYACDDLKIKGAGTLNVNGNCDDAIVCKNDLKLYNGTINVTAVDDGIRGKDSVTIGNSSDTDFSNLNITVNSKNGDGIKSTETDITSGKGYITVNGGTVNITAYSDGFHASQLLNVKGGTLDITTTCPATSSSSSTGGGGRNPGGGGEATSTSTEVSAKGLKAGCTEDDGTVIEGTINITGGLMNINTTDDSVHATDINISGGDITAATGDDGVHADNILTITDGFINITKSYEGLEAYDIEIKGGTIHVVASDDGFNAAGGNDSSGNNNTGGWNPGGMSTSTGILNISGGYMFVRAEGDGLDSNGNLNISGGTVIICGPTSGGNGIFDKGDGSYTLTMSGGTVFGIGSSDMMETPTATNGTYIVASSGVSLKAGNLISAADANGNVVAVLTVPADLNMTGAIQFYSTEATSTTKLYSGGTYNGTLNSDGYATGGTITGATAVTTSGGGTNPRG